MWNKVGEKVTETEYLGQTWGPRGLLCLYIRLIKASNYLNSNQNFSFTANLNKIKEIFFLIYNFAHLIKIVIDLIFINDSPFLCYFCLLWENPREI